MANSRSGQYPKGILTLPFVEEWETCADSVARFKETHRGCEPPAEGSIAEAFFPELERKWTSKTSTQHDAIITALHNFHGTKEGNWKELALALAKYHVPALRNTAAPKPGRKPYSAEDHRAIIELYEQTKNAMEPDAMTKQVLSRMATKLGWPFSKCSGLYYRAKQRQKAGG